MSLLLDRIPIEIFHIIFDYFWAHEILHSFNNISNYLDSILSNYNRYLINFESIRKSHFDLLCRSIRPEQVITLILSDKIETINQSQLFQSLFSIEQFTHLRALKLIELDDDGESFFSSLYKMPKLLSLEINTKINVPLIKRLPSLETFIINIPSGIHFNLDPSISMIQFKQLRHLTLSNCSCRQLQKIFDQAVQLTSVNISFTFLISDELHAFVNFHQEKTRLSSLISLNLFVNGGGKYINHAKSYLPFVSFSGHKIMRSYVERFLAPLQRLRRLELVIPFSAEHSLFDADQWERFLSNHLPRLSTFNFNISSWGSDTNIIDQYRRPFWLNRHWYVACNDDHSSLLTVPYFASTLMNHSSTPLSPNCTTLPIEQHHIFYDCVTDFTFDFDECKLPSRYNYVKKLFLRCSHIEDNVVDLSQVQTFIVSTTEWSLYKIITLIKEAMPAVNCLSLNYAYPRVSYQCLENISLKQVQNLCLPQYGKSEGIKPFNWSQLFPCVERLHISINSKSQIKCLLNQFRNLISGYFYVGFGHQNKNKSIQITRSWLQKQISSSKGKITKNFTYRIDNQFSFSLCLWIGENSY
ncbi:unnamed protein product [Adineta steineri]|uniref:F-box domain-containing protein n=1 Tax=Adineta steineri TaxID=433720 RepID=A0A815TDZ7_9BILA|nr:unnamed protein product [Adineta steineri]CAF1503999.1 unnamed protein product [Adineta steineri]